MKIKLLIDLEAARPFAKQFPELIEQRNGRPWIPAGTEYDWSDGWRLVNGGFAECVDEECRTKCEENPPTPQQSRHREYHERVIREQREFLEDCADEFSEDLE